MVKSVELVTINKKIPVFKNGEEAERIEVVNFTFSDGNECGYNVITQKDLYKIGDTACYIQPDFCISDLPIFESFIRPFGDEKKCRLGKNYRVRALKFNFSFEGSNDPIYSFGILMPSSDVVAFLKNKWDVEALPELLGVTKYEEPEKSGSGLTAGPFPSFLYKTDEENINNIKTHVTRIIESGQELGLTIKVDGSSWTLYFKRDDEGNYVPGICSRGQTKKLDQSYIKGYVDINHDGEDNSYHKYFDQETKSNGWFNDELERFISDDEIGDMEWMTPIMVKATDSWIDVANKFNIIEKTKEYCEKHGVELVLRGELNGSGLKGSGCKNNPDAKLEQNIKLFGIDSLESGFSIRQHYGNEHNLKKVAEELGVNYTESVTVKPASFDELIRICDDIFESEKAAGRLIEGIVIRTVNSNDLSCKYLSPEYDSKK